MIVNVAVVNKEADEFYKQGHLDYVLTNLNKFDKISLWMEYLKHEPIAYFTNANDWTFEGTTIYYNRGTEDEEVYEATMQIVLDGNKTEEDEEVHYSEILYHSIEASQSMFFQPIDDTHMRMIYVD